MPLLDHFRPPFDKRRHWQAFYHAWATYITAALNESLPEGYFAELNVRFELEDQIVPAPPQAAADPDHPDDTAPEIGWTPPPPSEIYEYYATADSASVRVYADGFDERMAAVIELVGPTHKQGAQSRSAFISRCQTYIEQGLGLILVDLVTPFEANLHAGLIARLMGDNMPDFEGRLYASAFRPQSRGQDADAGRYTHLETWFAPLAVGAPLPTLPLWLNAARAMPIDLEATYARTCGKLRLGARLRERQPEP